jgi:carbamoyl-phosphate synthase large subunit
MKFFNVLISSAGRRVELMQCFRDALRDLDIAGNIYAADCSLTSPACFLADQSWQVPRCSRPEFIPEMLDLAIREEIRVIIPTIDSELEPLAANKHLFAQHGIHVCISAPETVYISGDKVATHDWLIANGFPTVRQSSPQEVLSSPGEWPLPLFAKPRWGSASKGARSIKSYNELRAYSQICDDLLVQELAPGNEHTVNVFVNRDGNCVCAVPHRRLEVRAGEVSKAVTVKNLALMELACNIAETLPGARGPLNIQCFVTNRGDIRVIEINARAGGGYPLAHHAGAQFTHWILKELVSGRPAGYVTDWVNDLAMLRYDQAVIQPASSLYAERAVPAAVYSAGSR